MKIQYCSDLHLEFPDNRKWVEHNPIMPKGDVLILAGDIVLFSEMHKHQDFFDYVSEHFEYTFWIPGNHEYYHSDISQRSGAFEEKIRTNITLLNNTVKTINGVRLVFSTLWSHISVANQLMIKQSLSDFRVIRNKEQRLIVEDYNQLHQESRNFLEEVMLEKTTNPTVVISHHPPTFFNYPEKYANSKINEAFGTEMFSFIEKSEINYWIYGHHHCNVADFTIGTTKLITNQLGYVKYSENERFRKEALFVL